jgi:hypothetical protein
MKYLKSTQLMTLRGNPIQEGEEKATLGRIVVASLCASVDRATGEEKLRRYTLAEKISNAGDEIELTAEEVSLIKKMIGLAMPTEIVGYAYKVLDQQVVGIAPL